MWCAASGARSGRGLRGRVEAAVQHDNSIGALAFDPVVESGASPAPRCGPPLRGAQGQAAAVPSGLVQASTSANEREYHMPQHDQGFDAVALCDRSATYPAALHHPTDSTHYHPDVREQVAFHRHEVGEVSRADGAQTPFPCPAEPRRWSPPSRRTDRSSPAFTNHCSSRLFSPNPVNTASDPIPILHPRTDGALQPSRVSFHVVAQAVDDPLIVAVLLPVSDVVAVVVDRRCVGTSPAEPSPRGWRRPCRWRARPTQRRHPTASRAPSGPSEWIARPLSPPGARRPPPPSSPRT